MLFPTTCPVCGGRGPAPCGDCASSLLPAPAVRPLPGVDEALAFLAYDGAGRELVARLKYRNARDTVAGLGRAMAAMVDRRAVDVVTWAPTTPARRRRRGFDQAELLARPVARTLGRPCRRLLWRDPGPAQTGRGLDERRVAPVFRAGRGVAGARVLLVDDVITSGSTVVAAAAALRGAGATAVVALAAAHTPRRPVWSPPGPGRAAALH